MLPEGSATLRCPQCGGENPLPSGERVLHCSFCDAALFVDRGGLVSHYSLPRLVDSAAAREALRRWMAGNETVKDLDAKAVIETVEAIRFPLWLFRFGGGPEGETVRVEPAAPTPIPQLAELEVPAGKLAPFAGMEEGAELTSPTVPLETARGWLGEEAARARETALVDVPLWRCHYRFGGEVYKALIDGSTGSVMASIFPAKAEAPFYLLFAVGLALFLLEGLAITDPFLKFFVYGLTAIPLVLIAYWVARKV